MMKIQLLCSKKIGVQMEETLLENVLVDLYGSEEWTIGKGYEK
jgi:hypothetical protein